MKKQKTLWEAVLLLVVPLSLLSTGVWWILSERASGLQPTGPAAWTTTTLGTSARKAGDFWTDVDLDVSPRDPNNANDDTIYVTATRWEGNDFILFLYVSQDGGATWTKYRIKECQGFECYQARVGVAGFQDADIVSVGWQDLTPGNYDILVQTFCVTQTAVSALPAGPTCSGTPLTPDPVTAPRDTYTAAATPPTVIPLTPTMVNVSNSSTTSGNHDFGGREWTGSWDLSVSAICLTNNFPLVWALWAEDFNDRVSYSRSPDGQTWVAPADLPFPTSHTRFPSAYSGPDGALYAGTTTSGGGNPDVFLTVSTDCGQTWGPVANLSNNPGFSDAPQVAVTADGKIHAVYDDTTTAGANSADNLYTQCTRTGNQLTCQPAAKAIADGAFPHVSTDGTALLMAYRAIPGGKNRGLGISCSPDSTPSWAPAYELTDAAGILALASPTFTVPWGVHFLFIKGALTGQHAYVAWIQAGSNFVRVQLSKGVRPGIGC